MFPIRFGCVSFKYYLQLISQRQNFLHLSNTLANESAPRNPWILHTPEHVIRQPGGDSAAARWPGGLAAARPWQRHASLDTRLSLIAIVTIPPMARPRQCCKRTLATELRPWLRVAGHNGLAGSPVQTGSATLCPNPLLCSTPAFVFNALYCVYRPLLCSTPSIASRILRV